MATSVKILAAGDTAGNFDKLFSRAGKVNEQHGPFAALFVVGKFFGNDNKELLPYIRGEKQVPLDTYFIAGNEGKGQTEYIDKIPKGGSLCKNLTYLGRSGVTYVAGLSVAFLSGGYDPVHYREHSKPGRNIKYEPHYLEEDLKPVIDGSKRGADLLLTAEWGRGFHNLLAAGAIPKSLPAPAAVGSPVVADLASQVPARYHFAGTEDAFFQLPPYRNSIFCTRFFGLATIATKGKDRNVYACGVQPILEMSSAAREALPGDVTACPYSGAPAAAPSQSASESSGKAMQVDSGSSSSSAGTEKKETKAALDMARFSSNFDDGDGSAAHRWNMGASGDKKVPPPSYTCRICNTPGHYIQDCPEKRGQKRGRDSETPPDDYVCNICKQKGHFIRNCPQAGDKSKSGGRPPPQDYVCRICNQAGHWIQDCPTTADERGSKRQKTENKTNSECWFCLASEHVASHMIISVGEEAYVATAKGAIVDDHVLILPITHLPDTTQLTEQTLSEISKFKDALARYYASKQQVALFHERNIPTRAAQQHALIQVVPIPMSVASKVQSLIASEAEALGVEFKTIPEQQSLKDATAGRPYIVMELADGTRLLHLVRDGKTRGLFDFGRTVAAKLLGKPDRADWKRCQVSQQQESDVADRLKEQFKQFDFTAGS